MGSPSPSRRAAAVAADGLQCGQRHHVRRRDVFVHAHGAGRCADDAARPCCRSPAASPTSALPTRERRASPTCGVLGQVVGRPSRHGAERIADHVNRRREDREFVAPSESYPCSDLRAGRAGGAGGAGGAGRAAGLAGRTGLEGQAGLAGQAGRAGQGPGPVARPFQGRVACPGDTKAEIDYPSRCRTGRRDGTSTRRSTTGKTRDAGPARRRRSGEASRSSATDASSSSAAAPAASRFRSPVPASRSLASTARRRCWRARVSGAPRATAEALRVLTPRPQPSFIRQTSARCRFAMPTFGDGPRAVRHPAVADARSRLHRHARAPLRVCSRPGGTFGIDLVPDVPNWREYTDRVQLRGRAAGGVHLTLVESVRQDRSAAPDDFRPALRRPARSGRTTEHTFALTFRTLSVRADDDAARAAGFASRRSSAITSGGAVGRARGRLDHSRAKRCKIFGPDSLILLEF